MSADTRRLGVVVERIVLSGGGMRIDIGLDCAALRDGFHADEGSHRWTNGLALLPPEVLACFPGKVSIEVQIGETPRHYPVEAGIDIADPGAGRVPRTRP